MTKVSALLLAAVLMVLCNSGCAPASGAAANRKAEPKPVAVKLVAAAPTTMARTTTQPATVHAFHQARVYAKAAGYLIELRADIGKSVQKGEVLGVLGIPEMDKQLEAQVATIRRLQADERRAAAERLVSEASVASYEARREKALAEVGKADADLVAAKVELERAKDLVQQQAVAQRVRDEAQKRFDAAAASKAAAESAVNSSSAELALAKAQSEAAAADWDVAKATTDVARRQLEELEELIKYAKLTAPFDGVVTHRNVELGDLVRNSESNSSRPSAPLFVVAKLDQVRVRVAIPERDAPFANVGDNAKITLQALPGEVLEGEITRLAGVLDEKTRTMLIEIDLPNPEGTLRPGMFGQATITLAPPADSLTLPAKAVRYDEQGNSYVYVVGDANQIRIADVATGLDDGQFIEIVRGLEGDERIVGPVLRRLKPGQKVSVN